MRTHLLRYSSLLILASAAMLFAADSAKLNSEDSDFIKKAAQGGKAEVALGKLAATKTSNPGVRAFANRMVKDHSAANQKLTALAASKGVELPSGKGLGNDTTYMKLKVLSGKTFDKAYVDAMVDDHKEDIADFEKAGNDAKDEDVKSFAEKTLPTLRSHLEQIQTLQQEDFKD